MEKEYNLTPNEDRLIAEFEELTAIDSLSLQEREMADRLIPKLQQLGCEVEEDDAAAAIGGNAGNILARLPADPAASDAEPILLAAHMDTVVPGIGKKACRQIDENGETIIKGDGQAILGADDVGGIVEILEGIRILQENHIPHRPVEILFSVSEETYAVGAQAFDISKLRAKEAFVMDLGGSIGTAAIQAPSLIWFELTVTGKPAHAGFEPEKGINAIQATAKAIARIPQGQVDEETTFNIGRIEGGKLTNIVSENCVITGETRSYDHEKAVARIALMEEIFREETEAVGASYELKTDVKIRAFCWDEDIPACQRFRRAVEYIGAVPDDGKLFVSTFGGSDNNVFAQRGLQGIVPTCGMCNAHSVHEYISVNDLKQGARLVAALCMAE